MFFFFKQKTAYDVRISDWSSDVCSSDLGHEELGLGAVVDGADPQLVLNEDIVRDLAPSPNYLHAEMQRQLAEITRRREMYMHGIPPIDVARRTVILVDDGIPTGGTVRAAPNGLPKLGPARVLMAGSDDRPGGKEGGR